MEELEKGDDRSKHTREHAHTRPAAAPLEKGKKNLGSIKKLEVKVGRLLFFVSLLHLQPGYFLPPLFFCP